MEFEQDSCLYTIQQLVENMEICTTKAVSNLFKTRTAGQYAQTGTQRKRYKTKQNKLYDR